MRLSPSSGTKAFHAMEVAPEMGRIGVTAAPSHLGHVQPGQPGLREQFARALDALVAPASHHRLTRIGKRPVQAAHRHLQLRRELVGPPARLPAALPHQGHGPLAQINGTGCAVMRHRLHRRREQGTKLVLQPVGRRLKR